jgi:uridine phosphorylase
MTDDCPPILSGKHYAVPSVFTPDGLLREARRQKALPEAAVPDVCVLDPDGDLVRRLVADGAAVRDEGTSYHYLAPSTFSEAPASMLSRMEGAFDDLGIAVERGATWTTDAPFRETKEAVEAMRSRNLLAVEMEAAALYAFASATGNPVLCFAHVTNQMAQVDGDFEKGEADGTVDSLRVILAAARRFGDWRRRGS